MNVKRKDSSDTYKKIKFTYSVYGENGVYGGNATITLHHGSSIEVKMITLDSGYQALDDAEFAIIKKAINWIDDHLG